MENIPPATSSSSDPKGKRSVDQSSSESERDEDISQTAHRRPNTRTRAPRRVEVRPPPYHQYGSSSSSSSSPVSRQGPSPPPPPPLVFGPGPSGPFSWVGIRGGNGLPPMGLHAVPVGWGGGSSCRGGGGGIVIGGRRKGGGRAVGVGSTGGGAAARGKGKKQENGGGRRYACTVCPRTFDTRRGLFGHMRSHADRGCQGTFPPPPFSREDQFAEFNNVLINLIQQGGRGGAAAATAATPPPTNGGEENHNQLPAAGVAGDEAEIPYVLPDLNLTPPRSDDEN